MVATSVSLTDTIPTEVTFASGPFVTGGGSGGWNPGQRRVFWNGSVAPGSDVIVEYYVTVNKPLANGTVIINDATLGGSFGTVTTNQVSTVVQSDHVLAVNKSAPSAIGAGQRMTYTLQYNVTGNEPAPGVVITDSVPTNTSYLTCTGGCVQSGGLVTWTLGSLVPGNSGTVLLIVQVTTPLADGTVINNTAYISDAENAPVSGTASTTITSGHGFSLSKSDTGYDPVQAGGTVVYTLTWSVGGTGRRTRHCHHRCAARQYHFRELRRRHELFTGGWYCHLEFAESKPRCQRLCDCCGKRCDSAAQRHVADE